MGGKSCRLARRFVPLLGEKKADAKDKSGWTLIPPGFLAHLIFACRKLDPTGRQFEYGSYEFFGFLELKRGDTMMGNAHALVLLDPHHTFLDVIVRGSSHQEASAAM